MVSDESLFKRINKSFNSRIKVGNGQIIEAKGKGDVQVSTPIGTKVITDALFVLDIDQNLLSVGQLVEKNYSVVFESRKCVISDSNGHELMLVKMSDRSFVLNWNLVTLKLILVQLMILTCATKDRCMSITNNLICCISIAWLRTCLK